jgi:hypothetical protein
MPIRVYDIPHIKRPWKGWGIIRHVRGEQKKEVEPLADSIVRETGEFVIFCVAAKRGRMPIVTSTLDHLSF